MIDRQDLERFVPITLSLDEDEDVRLELAVAAVASAERAQILVFPDGLAETLEGAVQAYVELAVAAHDHDVNVIACLPLPPDLTEDLVGASREARHDAVTIFTRHGEVHVPQARLTPPSDGATPYSRINRVRIDLGRSLVRTCFLVGADLWALARVPPAELRFDLLVSMAALPSPTVATAHRILDDARRAGIAGATLLASTSPRGSPDETSRILVAPTALRVDPPTEPAVELDGRALATHFLVGGGAGGDIRVAVDARWATANWDVRSYPVTVVA